MLWAITTGLVACVGAVVLGVVLGVVLARLDQQDQRHYKD